MFKNCATCGADHETFVREMPDGSAHVHQDAETLRRRNAATIGFKIRANAAMGVDSPVMREALAKLLR